MNLLFLIFNAQFFRRSIFITSRETFNQSDYVNTGKQSLNLTQTNWKPYPNVKTHFSIRSLLKRAHFSAFALWSELILLKTHTHVRIVLIMSAQVTFFGWSMTAEVRWIFKRGHARFILPGHKVKVDPLRCVLNPTHTWTFIIHNSPICLVFF